MFYDEPRYVIAGILIWPKKHKKKQNKKQIKIMVALGSMRRLYTKQTKRF